MFKAASTVKNIVYFMVSSGGLDTTSISLFNIDQIGEIAPTSIENMPPSSFVVSIIKDWHILHNSITIMANFTTTVST